MFFIGFYSVSIHEVLKFVNSQKKTFPRKSVGGKGKVSFDNNISFKVLRFRLLSCKKVRAEVSVTGVGKKSNYGLALVLGSLGEPDGCPESCA